MARAPGNGRAAPRAVNGRMRCRKRLIICFDGTWNNADNGGNPTNVVRIARAIPSTGADGIPQIVYYEPGVGTGVFDKYIGGVFGRGLEQNVKDGYLFLAHNYCGRDEVYAADEIYVFGFSRGAYTARSLCGFIGACKGLLKPRSLHKLERAWKFYRTKPEKRNKFEHYEEIEQAVHKDVTIDCLGIWDTVGALGVPSTAFQMFNRRRYAFHDTEISRLVRNAFHAIAIDEKRSPFVPALWERPKQNIPDQIVEQVWFPGVHSNVGGSYPDTDIADLTLRWMIARVLCHTDLSFDGDTMDYLVPEKREHADAAAVQRVRDKWVGAIYESRSTPYLRDRLFPTLRIVAGQRPSKRASWARLYPVSATESFEQGVHWSVTERYSKWLAANIAQYRPPNLDWAWPEIQTKRVKVVTFESELERGTPWAGPSVRPRMVAESPPIQPAAMTSRLSEPASTPGDGHDASRLNGESAPQPAVQ